MAINSYQNALQNLAKYQWILEDDVYLKPQPKPYYYDETVEPESPKIGGLESARIKQELEERGQEPIWTSVSELGFKIRSAAMDVFQLKKDLPWDASSTNERATLALLPQYIEKLCSWDPNQRHLFAEWTKSPLTQQEVEAALTNALPPPLKRSSPDAYTPQ